MNAQEYIASGLLEAYVSGILSEAETAEIARAMVQYPEVRDEVAAIEETMFQLASANAVSPPAHLKNDIWNAIQQDNIQHHNALDPEPFIPQTTEKGRTIAVEAPQRKNSWAMAASVALLIGSLIANYILYNKNNTTAGEMAALKQQVDTLSRSRELMASAMGRYKTEADMTSNPDMEPIVMKTMQPGHPMAATIYWSKSTAEAYVSVQKLPMPPQGMQYQLWAIADGKPVDLGVLSNEMIGKQGMDKVSKSVVAGQAFAISLEKEGGSPSPTMDKIFVMGKATI